MNYVGQQTMHEREAASQMKYGQIGASALNAAPDKALVATRERIGILIERAIEVAARLEAIGDRAFGSVPQADAKCSAVPVLSGDIGAINDHLDALTAQIARAHDAMTRLESL